MRQILAAAFAFAILMSGVALAQDYAHSFDADKGMKVSWTVDGDKLHVQLSAPTEGWVGIGFDPEEDMMGANIIIGAVKDGKVRIEDHYGDRKRGHSPDDKLGGKNDVLDPQGTEEGGVTTISFALPLTAGDKADKAIDVSKTNRIIVAFGTGRDSFSAGHKYRGVYDVNFSTGEAKKIK